MVTKKQSYYQTLKRHRDEKRKSEPEPRFAMGCFLPQLTTGRTLVGIGWDPIDILYQATRIWSRLARSGAIRAAEAVGWEKWILTMEARQSEGVKKAATDHRKELGVTGHDMAAVSAISAAGVPGCGFDWHRVTELTDKVMIGTADGCPVIQSAREMGMADSPAMEEISLCCDMYDNFETRATSPDVWFTHTHCLGRGDKYCKFFVDYRKGPEPGENFYQTLKRLRDTKRKESPDPEKYFAPGYFNVQVLDRWSRQKNLELGVRCERRIAVGQVIMAADLNGWEKWINGMTEVEGPRLAEFARERAAKYGVTGSTALDASILHHLGMMGCGFDDHQVISCTAKRVEGVARSCPIVQSAKELGMEGSLGEISLWCDAYRNFEVHAANKNLWITHTHCLGRGDKLCRWIIEEMD